MRKLTVGLLSALLSVTAFGGDYYNDEDFGGYRTVATPPTVAIKSKIHIDERLGVVCNNCKTVSDYMWAGLITLQDLRPGAFVKVSNPAETAFYIVEIYPILIESNAWAINFNIKTPLGTVGIGGEKGQVDPDQTRIVVNSASGLVVDRKMSRSTFKALYPTGTRGLSVRATPRTTPVTYYLPLEVDHHPWETISFSGSGYRSFNISFGGSSSRQD
jgi:hypothetical protein